MKSSIARFFLLFLVAALGSACAANLCERKDRFFRDRCAGSDVSYSPDPLCLPNLDRCSEGQLAAMAAYVQCLESANVCSLEVIGTCAEQHPGGVNLQCPTQG